MAATEALRLSLARLQLSNQNDPSGKDSDCRDSELFTEAGVVKSTPRDNDVTMKSQADNNDDPQLSYFVSPSLPLLTWRAVSPMRRSVSLSSSLQSFSLSQSSSSLESKVKRVDRPAAVQEIISDIYVVPRRTQPEARVSLSPPMVDLDVANVPFLSNGRHRLWTVNYEGSASSHQCLQRCRSRHEHPPPPLTHPYAEQHDSHHLHRWKRLVLSSQFWAAIPGVANAYLHLTFNATCVGAICYAVWCFVASLRKDVSNKLLHHTKEMSLKAAECLSEYDRNKCDRNQRVPALEQLCNGWALCIDTAKGVSQRATLSAETLGQVLNTFLEQISWRSVVLLAISILSVFVCLNILLSFSRWKFEKLSDKLSSPSSFQSSDNSGLKSVPSPSDPLSPYNASSYNRDYSCLCPGAQLRCRSYDGRDCDCRYPTRAPSSLCYDRVSSITPFSNSESSALQNTIAIN